jgi:thiamine biosynthesis lipoprotein
MIWQLPFLALLIAGSIIVINRQHSLPYQHDTGFIFGTIYNCTYESDKDINAEIVGELQKVDNSLSPFNDKSIIAAINNNKPIEVDDMFQSVFDKAMTISKETDGAFDITVAPLVNAWGFGFKSGNTPTAHAIDSLKSFIGYNKVKLINGRVVKSDPRLMLDCSGIAKGYGCDVVAQLFDRKGIKNYMIEIGGEIVAKGVNDKRQTWKIGVTKPTDDSLDTNNELETILNISNVAMATSGNYRNFYYKGGKKYAHTIDPKTGYPVQHNILSSTVITNDCATSDGYATAFMVMGLDKAKLVLNKHHEIMAYFIYSDNRGKNKVWFSPALADKVQK